MKYLIGYDLFESVIPGLGIEKNFPEFSSKVSDALSYLMDDGFDARISIISINSQRARELDINPINSILSIDIDKNGSNDDGDYISFKIDDVIHHLLELVSQISDEFEFTDFKKFYKAVNGYTQKVDPRVDTWIKDHGVLNSNLSDIGCNSEAPIKHISVQFRCK